MRELICSFLTLLLLLVGKSEVFLPLSLPFLGLGGLMILGFFAGELARKLQLPGVVGFILTGILLGPQISALLPEEALGYEALNFIILGLVGFQLGATIKIMPQDFSWRSLVLAMLVASFAFSFTMASLIMLGFSTGLAALLGAIASSSAPVLVFGRDRDGSLKGGILLYVTSAGTAVSLLIWIIALAKIDLFGNGEVAAWERITRPVLGTIILVAIGLFWGWMLDRFCSAIGSPSTIVLLILGMLFIGYVVSKDLVGDPLILGVACGLFVGNRSKRAERITGSTESVSRMALILLFGLFGAQINLKALFTSSSILWPPAIIYILAMVGGKAAGAVIGLRLLKIKDIRPLYLLSGVSCQAIVTSSLLIATQPRLAGTQYRQDIIAVATLGIILGSLVFPAVMGSETSGLKAVKA